ncbi:Uncharacterized membrane protein [Draconibacterium orientale]|uniref:Membrane protein n=1 Tax=Draconibacterium orientale TaxID=1168034 RepID=X5DXF8_9BACT|nr:DUF502 domain-containing protein [Draconibacterium orientale]AHW58956.1 membrane protein [Draconibacterium orientale]SET51862.1 Uncharacterized membrane protein [Draconibacterium orientale]
MKKLFNYLLQGLLYIAPLGITIYVIYLIFNFIDNLLDDYLEKSLGIDIPGLGILVIVGFLIIVGIIGQSIIARPFQKLFKKLLEKVPLLRFVFSAMNDLFSAFVGKEKKFNKPVIVLVNPISNLEKLGFLTEEDLGNIGETEKVAVYFPHSYNFSGEMFIVPKEQVKPIDINPAVVMKFIVSGGVSKMYDDPNDDQGNYDEIQKQEK